MANKRKEISEEHKIYIEEYYNNVSIRQIAKDLGIDKYYVKRYMEENNLTVSNKIKTIRVCDYTSEEEQFIKDNYLNMPYSQIAKKLNKSEQAIRTKISKMGLKNKSEKWSNKELKLLKEVYPKYIGRYLVENYFPNRNIQSINKKAEKLGLKKETNNRFTKNDLKQKLINLANELGRTPLYSELSGRDDIPSVGTYSRYFGGYEQACIECGLEVKKCLFGNYVNTYIAKDNVTLCLSKAELVITNFFIDNNISFEKEKYYSDIFNEDYGYKRCDWYLDEYDIIVEYFGLPNKDYYKKKMDEKYKICKSHKKELIGITDRYVNENKLKKIFKKYI